MASKEPEQPKTMPEGELVGLPSRVRIAPPVWGDPGPATPLPPGTRARAHLTCWPGDESPWPGRLVTADIAAAVA